MQNLSIRWQLALATGLTALIALLLAGGVMAFYDSGTYRAQKSSEAAALARLLASSVSASVVFDDVKAADEQLGVLKASDQILAAAAYRGDGSQVAVYARANVPKPPAQPEQVGVRIEQDATLAFAPIMEGARQVGTVFVRSAMESSGTRLGRYAGALFIAMILALLVAVPASMQLHRRISDPLREISAAASRIAAGDLRVEIAPDRRNDEIGMLRRSFAGMLAGLQQMTREISGGAKLLADKAGEILATTSQVSSSVAETAASVNETSVTMEQVRQTVEMASDKARLVQQTSQSTAEAAKSGRDAVEQVAVGMTHIREQVEGVAASILRLSEQGHAIGEIIAAVSDLADQSNILAVNAAIEAAHAGEHGRGFAVVAQEVKNLADQSKQATSQVRLILGEIQKATATAVLATERGSKAVDQGVAQSVQAGEAIRVLTENLDVAAEVAVQIAASARQQMAGVSQVAQAMESIREASAMNASGIKQTEAAVKTVNELGQSLRSLVQKYQA